MDWQYAQQLTVAAAGVCAHRAVDHDGLGGKNGNQVSWPAATTAVQRVNDGNIIFKECTKPENLQVFLAQQIH